LVRRSLRAELIEIGEYTVSVEKQGFKTQTASGVIVELQQKARVNFEMQLGATTERVEVVAAGVELKTDDAAMGRTVDHTRVVELPVINRNFASLLVLTPGVQFGTRMGMNGLSTANSFWPGATQVSANGQRDANQRVTLDRGYSGRTARQHRVSQSIYRRHRGSQDSNTPSVFSS
jgi:hypothetical protein